MKYWVYIDEQVLPQPYDEAELTSIPGFNAETLICPENTPEGQEQQWYAAKEIFDFAEAEEEPAQEEYAQEAVPAQEEFPAEAAAVEEVPAQEEVYPQESYAEAPAEQEAYSQPEAVAEQPQEAAPALHNPEPVKAQYGDDSYLSEKNMDKESLLLQKIEYLISEISTLKKDISVLNEQAASMTMYGAAPAQNASDSKKNEPIVKDPVGLHAFRNAKGVPLDEKNIPEEGTSDGAAGLKSSDGSLAEENTGSADFLQSAIENTIRMKSFAPAAAPSAFDLASNQKIEIPSEPKEENKENPAAAEEPAAEAEQEKTEQEENAGREDTLKLSEPVEDEVIAAPQEPEAVQETETEGNKESDVLEIASVGNKEEEDILKTFAEEKQEEQNQENDNKEFEEIESSFPQEAKPADDIISVDENYQEPFENNAAQEPAFEAAEEAADQNSAAEEEQAPAEQPAGDVSPLEALTMPPAGAQEAQAHPEGLAPVENLEDKFLKTFTSSIEEISLDQPTSIISDYVPPTVSSDNPLYDADSNPTPANEPANAGMADLTNQPVVNAADVRNVKRIKPAAIKTVPMVAAGEPITNDYNNSNMEEAVTEIRQQNSFMTGLKVFALCFVFLLVMLGFCYILSAMGILPERFSPIHSIKAKFMGPGIETTPDALDSGKKTAAAAAVEEDEEEDEDMESPEKLQADNIIFTVKNYTFSDGSTLENKLQDMNRNSYHLLEWSATRGVDSSYYSVAATLPPNAEGYSVTYKFDYNTVDGSLKPTNSSGKNVFTHEVSAEALANMNVKSVESNSAKNKALRPASSRRK